MEREKRILKFWKENKIFEKSENLPDRKSDFIFYDGPPFATGLPHYGHLLASAIKDAIPRYQIMKGKKTRRRWGWDCHGLPLENVVEAELGFKSKKDIEDFGIDKFNQRAKESVMRFAEEWKEIIPRFGRFVDMENDYRTMDSAYTESVWWVFKMLYEKGLIYEGYKSMHLCPRCETTLANFEVNQGYKDITDISVTVKLAVEGEPNAFFLVWTTTPWTLPGNVALAINPKVIYCNVKIQDEIYILAKERITEIIKTDYQIIKEYPGQELIGKTYAPLFDYYAKDKTLKNRERGWKVYAADFVNTEEGTGIVHIAPAFGEDDYALSQKENLPFIQHVSTNGAMKSEVTDFAGEQVKPKDDHQRADVAILKYLAAKGTLFTKEKIVHSYPHCWRCDTPLLNYASNSWFVKVTAIKDKLIEANEKINWVPEHIKEGRFGKWLEGARDWAISRSRFWGAPIPAWKCDKCGKTIIVSSIKELGEKSETDLHRPRIDEIILDCSCGGKMKRVPEVFDCWFESGAMPYGQWHYPFENGEIFNPEKEIGFPADFIAEGLDQTRGWFYSLLVLGVALFGKSPYRNVIVNGLILAENGQKMSKKLKNYPDPAAIMEKYGADALRFYLLSSPVVRAEDLNFSEKGVAEIFRKNINRLDNVLVFYETYKREEREENKFSESENALDKWIISRLGELTEKTEWGMENYQIDQAAKPISDFIDDLSTWYLRRSRERIKNGDEESKKAIGVIRYVLGELSKLMAPLTPFIAEDIYQRTKSNNQPESVHLASWPENKIKIDAEVLEWMEKTRSAVSAGLELRDKARVKIKQPLALFVTNVKFPEAYLPLIKEELNVRKILIREENENIAAMPDMIITPELKEEGNLRDIIRAIQNLRKKEGLNPRETASLIVSTDKSGKIFVNKFREKIEKAVSLSAVHFEDNLEGEKIISDGVSLTVRIKR